MDSSRAKIQELRRSFLEVDSHPSIASDLDNRLNKMRNMSNPPQFSGYNGRNIPATSHIPKPTWNSSSTHYTGLKTQKSTSIENLQLGGSHSISDDYKAFQSLDMLPRRGSNSGLKIDSQPRRGSNSGLKTETLPRRRKRSVQEDQGNQTNSYLETLRNPEDHKRIMSALRKRSAFNISKRKVDNSKPGIESDIYNFNHSKRGKVLIFNNKEFLYESTRVGADADLRNLITALPRLGFEEENIYSFIDLSRGEIEDILEEVRRRDDLEENDCIMIFIMTHGQDNNYLWARDATYTTERVMAPFLGDLCESLVGKPKLFFFVACRGNETDAGVNIRKAARRPSTSADASVSDKHSYTIPVHADMLAIHSTTPNNYSFRETDRGTWYIEALCSELNKINHNDSINLIDLLIKVNKRLAISYTTYNTENSRLHEKKQCSTFSSTLTRKIIIPPRLG